MADAIGVEKELRATRDRGPEPFSARQAYAALAGGLAILVVFTGLIGTAANPWIYLVGAVYGTALSTIGALRMPPARRRIWLAFAAAQVLYLLGDLTWTLYTNVLHLEPYPSVADVFYLAMYPALALGMWWLVRGRRRGRDRAAFLDAAILTTAVTVIGVVFFVAPAARNGGTELLGQVVGAAYPAGDLLLLAVALRLLTAGMARNVALWSMLASVAVLLVIDLYYVVTVINDAAYPAWIDCGYLLSYMLLGFAVLHPSAHALSEPAPDRPDRITLTRVSLLGIALVLVPVTEQVADMMGFRHSSWVVFAGGCVAALLVVLRLWGLVQDLQSKAVQLAALAEKDGLTGVANRRTWDHELSRACARARETGTPLSAAVLDMDHFKEFNDTHGHLAGDLVLKETTAAWASILEGRGFLARYGGEEFTVLLPQLEDDDAQAVLERLRRAVSHDQTCSIGVATWDAVETPAELMSRADDALYRAKRSGRDRVASHRDGRAIVVTRPLHESPAMASLTAVYQPIVELATGEVVAYEALSRFAGRDPREVFDAATRDGTGPAMEALAIGRALAGWGGDGLLTVNVSPSVLTFPEVRDVLPADLSGLVLEISETDLVEYTPDVMLALDDVRTRGGLLAIDDFGVGFSNVHRVATIRPDIVKIDMSLVRHIDADPALQAVVRSCALYAELTGARLVAEGIETVEERECVAGLGVELGQGYLLGAPGPLPQTLSAGR